VIIARHPCLILSRPEPRVPEEARKQLPNALCTSCGSCIASFECPALVMNEDASRVLPNIDLCVACGICRFACIQDELGPGRAKLGDRKLARYSFLLAGEEESSS